MSAALSTAQPYSGTDITAGVLLVLGLLLARVWQRWREPGLGWIALGLALLSVFYFSSDATLPTTAHFPRDWRVLPAYMGVLSVTGGTVEYLALPATLRRRVAIALQLPSAVGLVMVAAAVLGLADVERRWPNLLLTATVAGTGIMAILSHRREPGVGHAWVGTALLASVLGPAVAIVLDGSSVALRYWGGLGQLVFGLTTLAVVVWRRQREMMVEVQRRRDAEAQLQQANEGLESEVARRTDELRQLVAGLKAFNRNVSHDLRGPLGGIAGAAELARDALARADPATARRMLDAIAVQARVSADLVDALLRLAQVADVPLSPQRVDLQTMAQSVVEQALHTGHAARFPTVNIDAHVQAWADPALLRAVLTNLLTNAVKFSRVGNQPQIEIHAQSGPGEVEVVVSDNGVGFDPAAAETMFEPFHRLHGASFEGHGVGLSIVRRAVERQGGRVWAKGQPQQGAQFHFTLPVPARAAPSTPPPPVT